MSISNVRHILVTLRSAAHMPVGEGWLTPSEIIRWSGVSHSTVYRYLAKLIKEGYIISVGYTLRGMNCKMYKITDAGQAWISGERKLV